MAATLLNTEWATPWAVWRAPKKYRLALYVDKHRESKKLPFNAKASALFFQKGATVDGPALLCADIDLQESDYNYIAAEIAIHKS